MTSSLCSMTSSINSTTSSLSSPSSLFLLSDGVSVLTFARHAFHSLTALLRDCMSSALTLLSRAASSSSNPLPYSRRFFRTAFCCSLLSSVRGRGLHKNCLNRSTRWRCCSCPRKSQIAYPFSTCYLELEPTRSPIFGDTDPYRVPP